MLQPPVPVDETERLLSLHSLRLLERIVRIRGHYVRSETVGAS
jgi:hypothetical protein